jgi:glycosyltransferase involved in cell wall biosynthesis
MQRPRVLFVTRRFWPFSDDACHRLLHQTELMRRAGVESTVLTARWHTSWPEFSLCREVPIHRLLPAPYNNWNESHFQRNVIHWLTKHHASFDCIYVDRADGLLAAIVAKTGKWAKPVLTRFAPDDSGFGLANSQKLDAPSMVDCCRRCFRIVCSTPFAHRLLISQGINENQIVRIPDCDWDQSSGISNLSHEQASAAGRALFGMSSDFVVPGRSSIVIHLGLSEAKRLKVVLKSVCDLLDAGALIRMWIIGCGVPPSILYDLVKSRGWHREILIFDGFDDLQELVQVADLAIVSNPGETLQYSLPLLAQAAVPTIILDHPDCRAWLPDAHHFQLYSSELMFEEKLNDWLSHPEKWNTMAQAMRQSLRRMGSAEECTRLWSSLFRDSSTNRTA